MLNARRVLVTGSNRGIGLELIQQLLGNSKRPEWIFAAFWDPEGPHGQAPLAVDASVRAILNTLGRLSEKDNSTFVNWAGAAVPW